MATANLEPNGDASAGWVSTLGTHYGAVAKATAQPTAPSTTDYIYVSGGGPSTADLNMATTTVASVSQVKVWVYGDNGAGNAQELQINVNMGGWQTQSGNIWNGVGAGWRSATFNGSWTQGNLDGLQVRLYGFDDGYNSPIAYAVYAEITYTEASGSVGSQAMVLNAAHGNI